MLAVTLALQAVPVSLSRIMLAIVVDFEIHPGSEAEAIAALGANAAGSRTEPGCLKWEWSRRLDDPNRFAIYELYTDEAAIKSHKASEHFDVWKGKIDSFLKKKSAGIYEVAGKDDRPVP